MRWDGLLKRSVRLNQRAGERCHEKWRNRPGLATTGAGVRTPGRPGVAVSGSRRWRCYARERLFQLDEPDAMLRRWNF